MPPSRPCLPTSSKPPVANRSSRLDLPTPLSPTSRICAARWRAGARELWTRSAFSTQHAAAEQQIEMRKTCGGGRRQADGGVTPPAQRRQRLQARRQHRHAIDRKAAHLEGVVRLGLQARLCHTCARKLAGLRGCRPPLRLWQLTVRATDEENSHCPPALALG